MCLQRFKWLDCLQRFKLLAVFTRLQVTGCAYNASSDWLCLQRFKWLAVFTTPQVTVCVYNASSDWLCLQRFKWLAVFTLSSWWYNADYQRLIQHFWQTNVFAVSNSTWFQSSLTIMSNSWMNKCIGIAIELLLLIGSLLQKKYDEKITPDTRKDFIN